MSKTEVSLFAVYIIIILNLTNHKVLLMLAISRQPTSDLAIGSDKMLNIPMTECYV